MLLRAALAILALLALLAPGTAWAGRSSGNPAESASAPCCGGACTCGDGCPCAKPAKESDDDAAPAPARPAERRIELPNPPSDATPVAVAASGRAPLLTCRARTATGPAGRELLARIALLTI